MLLDTKKKKKKNSIIVFFRASPLGADLPEYTNPRAINEWRLEALMAVPAPHAKCACGRTRRQSSNETVSNYKSWYWLTGFNI